MYKQGKLKLYTSIKERRGFENYLNLPNHKLRQAITKFRISAHKFPIETGRFEQKHQTERICPLCCDGIGDEVHYLANCQNLEVSKVRNEFLQPFYKQWKNIHNISKTDFCRAILVCQNDDMVTALCPS